MFKEIECYGPGDCSNRGICDVSTGICICDFGFQGDMCQGKNFLLLTNVHMVK